MGSSAGVKVWGWITLSLPPMRATTFPPLRGLFTRNDSSYDLSEVEYVEMVPLDEVCACDPGLHVQGVFTTILYLGLNYSTP